MRWSDDWTLKRSAHKDRYALCPCTLCWGTCWETAAWDARRVCVCVVVLEGFWNGIRGPIGFESPQITSAKHARTTTNNRSKQTRPKSTVTARPFIGRIIGNVPHKIQRLDHLFSPAPRREGRLDGSNRVHQRGGRAIRWPSHAPCDRPHLSASKARTGGALLWALGLDWFKGGAVQPRFVRAISKRNLQIAARLRLRAPRSRLDSDPNPIFIQNDRQEAGIISSNESSILTPISSLHTCTESAAAAGDPGLWLASLLPRPAARSRSRSIPKKKEVSERGGAQQAGGRRQASQHTSSTSTSSTSHGTTTSTSSPRWRWRWGGGRQEALARPTGTRVCVKL